MRHRHNVSSITENGGGISSFECLLCTHSYLLTLGLWFLVTVELVDFLKHNDYGRNKVIACIIELSMMDLLVSAHYAKVIHVLCSI